MESDSVCRFSLTTGGNIGVGLTVVFIIVLIAWASTQSASSGAGDIVLLLPFLLPAGYIGGMILAAVYNTVMCGGDADTIDWLLAGAVPVLIAYRLATSSKCSYGSITGSYKSSDGSFINITQGTGCTNFTVQTALPSGRSSGTYATSIRTIGGNGNVIVLGGSTPPLFTISNGNTLSDGAKSYTKL